MSRTLLHTAVIEEQVEVVSDLVNQGADVNAKDFNGDTPLQLAIETRNLNILKLLLDAGVKNYDKSIGLRKAIRSNNENMLKLLINAGASVGEIDEESTGSTSLHAAAEWGNSNILKVLIDAGADVNATDYFKKTPLSMALKSKNVNAFKLLLKAGADINAESSSGLTLLHTVIKSRDLDTSKMLIDAGANVNAFDCMGNSCLHMAIISGYVDIVKLLIDSGANVNDKNEDEITPLCLAVQSKNIYATILLIVAGADVHYKGQFGNTHLHRASKLDCIRVPRFLIYVEADIDAENENGDTPLHIAVESNNVRVVKLLIDFGADVEAFRYETFSRPLHVAAENENIEIMKLLVYSGADVNVVNYQGTPLTLFIKVLKPFKMDNEKKNKIVDCLKLLIESTDVNITQRITKRNSINFILESNFSKGSSINYNKIIIEHIAVLITLNLNVNSCILKTISNTPIDNEYFTKCKIELEKAKSTRLHNCWVTFFDLIVSDRYKIVKYAGNEDLVQDLKKHADDFPIYGPSTNRKMVEGIGSRKLFDDAANRLSYHFPIFKPSHLIVRGILDSLTVEDWTKLNEKEKTFDEEF